MYQRGEVKLTVNRFHVCGLRKRVQGDYVPPCYPEKQTDTCRTDTTSTLGGQRCAPETRSHAPKAAVRMWRKVRADWT